jgi:peptide/nickel transport system permease protein
MTRYFVRRLIGLFFVLIGMSLVTFTTSHLVPADPAAAAAGLHGGKEQIETIRREMGLDRPLPEQYLRYMAGVARGDLGRSIMNNSSVTNELKLYLPASLELALAALALYIPLGLFLGVVSGTRPGGWVDAATRAFAILGVSVPVFWLALMMQFFLYGKLGWFPATGRIGSEFGPPPLVSGLFTIDTLLAGRWDSFKSVLHHLAMPAMALAAANLAIITRMTRSSMLEVLHQDYIRTARAKGLAERLMLSRHALRNALIPVVTVIALQMAALIAWQFLVETIFSWPGIGSFAVRAIVALDFNVIMGVTLFGSVLYVLVNFLADVTYMALDPRIRY